MERFFNILATIGLAAMLVALGWLVGRRTAKPVIAGSVTATDTVWVETHDTCFVVKETRTVRHDTVRLATVSILERVENPAVAGANGHENAISWTCQDGYGHGNGESWTHPDTLFIHDSVYVEVPIEEKEFTGENYRIITEGYRTRLKDVWIYTPMVTNTVTNTVTRTRHWTGGVGVQIGYGYTTGGMSPYAGIGVSFGYVF